MTYTGRQAVAASVVQHSDGRALECGRLRKIHHGHVEMEDAGDEVTELLNPVLFEDMIRVLAGRTKVSRGS